MKVILMELVEIISVVKISKDSLGIRFIVVLGEGMGCAVWVCGSTG